MKLLLFFFSVLTLAIVSVWQSLSVQQSWQLQQQNISENNDGSAVYSQSFVFQHEAVASVHASAIVATADNEMMAVWYGGSREGSMDVAIYASRKETGSSWSEPEALIDRELLARDTGRYIKKLGNPVLLSDGEQTVWMFFVSTSVGGWSTSAINLIISHDGGHNWSRAARLVTSPFINLSTLVKGRPFFYRDGSIGLPAYHELAGKFAELIRVSRTGTVINKTRITHGRYTIQPSIVSLSEDELVALMRNTNPVRRIVRAYGKEGGRQWSKANYTDLPNPDAAVSMAGDENLLVLAYNNLKHDRNQLALAVSLDKGHSWIRKYQLESSDPDEHGVKSEFSYPYLYQTKDGGFHLVYTWQRRRIAYVHFNKAWLEQLP